MGQGQYRSSPGTQSKPDHSSHSHQPTSYSSSNWLDELDRTSQLSWSYSQVSGLANRDDFLSSPQNHQSVGKRGGPLQTLATNFDASSVSNISFIQQATTSAGADDEELFFMDLDESISINDPGGPGLAAQFHRDIPDLMFTPADFQESDMHAQRLQWDSQSNRGVLDAFYTPELFEREYPFEQINSSTQARPIPLPSNDAYIDDCVVQLQAMSAASRPSSARLTDTEQTRGVLVFDSITGAQQRSASKRRRRKTSEAQRRHRKLIRDLGGQCESCRARKRRVS